MAEVLVEFDTILTADDGTRWVPRAAGRASSDGLWEGWIEFLDMSDSKRTVRSPRETEQPNRDDLMYWAQGLTQTYLEGALSRALDERPATTEGDAYVPARFDGPKTKPAASASATTGAARPLLNPFEVFQQGEDILIQELDALPPARVRDLVIAYNFASAEDAYGASRGELTARIVEGVRRPLAQPRSDRPSEPPEPRP
jgi:hypothetical protein